MNKAHLSLRRSIPSLHGLVLFEASARYLNFSKAAEELSISQPAVSHGIRQLEDALGHPLFVRERRALSLTSQGQRLFTSVSGGLASISDTIQEITGAPRRDTIVVSTSTVMATEWLMPRMHSLRETHPDLIVDLRCLDRDPDLAANGIDLHLRLGDGHWPNCDAALLWAERIVPVCSPRYLEKRGAVRTAADFLDHELVHYIDSYRFRIGWAEWFRANEVAIPPKLPAILHVNDSLLALKAAENGEGIALGWRPIIDRALADGRLVMAYSKTLETGRHHYAVTLKGPGRKRVATTFSDWLVSQAAGIP